MQEAQFKETSPLPQQPKLVLLEEHNIVEIKKSVFHYFTTKISNGISRVIRFVEVYQEKDE